MDSRPSLSATLTSNIWVLSYMATHTRSTKLAEGHIACCTKICSFSLFPIHDALSERKRKSKPIATPKCRHYVGRTPVPGVEHTPHIVLNTFHPLYTSALLCGLTTTAASVTTGTSRSAVFTACALSRQGYHQAPHRHHSCTTHHANPHHQFR